MKDPINTSDFIPSDITICGAYGCGNAGDETILRAILQQLRAFAPQARICVLSRTPQSTARENGVASLHTFSFFKVIRQLRRTRLFISGGGSLIQDVTSSRSLFYYLWTLHSAHRKGARVMMYGCGVGPVSGRFNRWLTGKVIDRCVDRIALRDPDSRELLRELGVTRPEIFLTADPAIDQQVPREKIPEYMAQAGLEPGKPYCMFVLRPWQEVSEQLDAFAAAAEYAYETHGLTPVFFPFEARRDQEITQQAADLVHCPRVVVPGCLDGTQICGILSQMTAVVSMRLHALIFAASQGVSIAGISYDPKVKGFLDYLGQKNYISTQSISPSALCALVDQAVADHGSMEPSVERMRRLARENGELARQLYLGENC